MTLPLNKLPWVIHRFNAELSSRGLDPETVCLVTDGQLPIRQCLFPEAQRKGITLPAYYSKFHDLRKEFSAAYPDSPVSEVEDMLKSKFRFSRCPLTSFFWLLSHVIYLKLTRAL